MIQILVLIVAVYLWGMAGYDDAVADPAGILDQGIAASAHGDILPPGFSVVAGVPTLTIPADVCSAVFAPDTCEVGAGFATYRRVQPEPLNTA